MIALPLFVFVFVMVFVDFNVVWRYFAWTNQTLAVFTLWAGTVFLYRKYNNKQVLSDLPLYKRSGYYIALIPALFMTMVSVSYIFIAPEGFKFASIGLSWLAYTIAAVITAIILTIFILWTKKQ